MISGKYIKMIGQKKDVIYDLDGSLAAAFGKPSLPSSTLLANFNHVLKGFSSQCSLHTSNSANWDSTILCDDTTTIRRIWFTNAINSSGSSFYNKYMYVVPVKNATETYNSS